MKIEDLSKKHKRIRDRILDTIADWESGKKESPVRPSIGSRYQLEMREEIKRLLKQLKEFDQKAGIKLPDSVYVGRTGNKS